MRNTYTSYTAPEIMSQKSWRQILMQQTFDDTDTFPNWTFMLCGILQHAETVPKLCLIDDYTIFHKAAFCSILPHSIVWMHLYTHLKLEVSKFF